MRYKITIPSLKSLESTRDILGRSGVVVLGTRKEPPTLYCGELPEAVERALLAVGCKVEADDLEEFECIEFSDKIDHTLAMILHSMAPEHRDKRHLSVITRTTLSPSEAEQELEPFEYQAYPGFGSTFIMTVSVVDVEKLINEEWVVRIVMPRTLSLPD